jgi:hypothetical protein
MALFCFYPAKYQISRDFSASHTLEDPAAALAAQNQAAG